MSSSRRDVNWITSKRNPGAGQPDRCPRRSRTYTRGESGQDRAEVDGQQRPSIAMKCQEAGVDCLPPSDSRAHLVQQLLKSLVAADRLPAGIDSGPDHPVGPLFRHGDGRLSLLFVGTAVSTREVGESVPHCCEGRRTSRPLRDSLWRDTLSGSGRIRPAKSSRDPRFRLRDLGPDFSTLTPLRSSPASL